MARNFFSNTAGRQARGAFLATVSLTTLCVLELRQDRCAVNFLAARRPQSARNRGSISLAPFVSAPRSRQDHYSAVWRADYGGRRTAVKLLAASHEHIISPSQGLSCSTARPQLLYKYGVTDLRYQHAPPNGLFIKSAP
jgi:hypothetical protein